jgi:hypothetical protein
MSTATQTAYVPESIGDAFVNSPEFKAHVPFHFGQWYRVELKAAGDPVDFRPPIPGVARGRRVPQTVVDFCTTIRTTGGSVYTGITGVSTILPTLVAQGNAKPGMDMVVSAKVVPVETVAGYYKASVQMLEDVIGARELIDGKLAALVRIAEHNQILMGTGTSPQLQGLNSVTAIPSAADVSAGIATVRANGYSPNCVAVTPGDALKIVTLTGNAYDSTFGTESVFGAAIVYSTAMNAGTGFVGDFAQGATLYRRDDFHIIVGNVNDDLTKNLVTLVGESRLAFLVNDPAAFAKITIT